MSHHTDQAMRVAKIEIMGKMPFFAHIGLQLPFKWNDNIPTARTNYTSFEFNTSFFMGLTHPMRVFLIAHEIGHVAFMHNIRVGDRDPIIWNKACDYVINFMLVASGFTMPNVGIYDVRFGGMSTEQVYDILIRENEPNDDFDYLADIVFGDGDSGDDIAPPPTQEQIDKVKSIVHRATVIQKITSGDIPGEIPGEVLRVLDQLLNPVLPWQRIVDRYLNASVSGGFTWRRPNRRFCPDMYLPSLKQRTLGNVVVAFDLSGSIEEEQEREMLTEVESLRRKYHPTKLTILDCDWSIHNIHRVKPTCKILDLQLNGGGGTSFKPVERFCDQEKPDLLIYFTDLEIDKQDDITENKPYNILWINHGEPDLRGTIGRTVQYRPNSKRN